MLKFSNLGKKYTDGKTIEYANIIRSLKWVKFTVDITTQENIALSHAVKTLKSRMPTNDIKLNNFAISYNLKSYKLIGLEIIMDSSIVSRFYVIEERLGISDNFKQTVVASEAIEV